MVKFMIIFYKPNQPETFENTYNDFLALVERMPHIRRRQVIDVLGEPRGNSRFYRILEVYYDDYEQLQASLNSPPGQETGGELDKFPYGSYEMIFADVYEESGGQTKAEE
jgi:uncharacterized protein (TIGR02118 family)